MKAFFAEENRYESASAVRDSANRNHSSKQHPVLDVNAENVEPLDKHVQGPRYRAVRLRADFSHPPNISGGSLLRSDDAKGV